LLNFGKRNVMHNIGKNTYIDIGTCLTPMMDMPTHRGYLQAYWNYQGGPDIQKICKWN
jgi:hypothetical protein